MGISDSKNDMRFIGNDSRIDMRFIGNDSRIDMRFIGNDSRIDMRFIGADLPPHYPIYEGPYFAIPNNAEQIFETHGMQMSENFVVHKIPQNYGLVTYDGFSLTIT